jgi:hypothetical protein
MVGIPAALVVALSLALVHEAEHWLRDDLPDALGLTVRRCRDEPRRDRDLAAAPPRN